MPCPSGGTTFISSANSSRTMSRARRSGLPSAYDVIGFVDLATYRCGYSSAGVYRFDTFCRTRWLITLNKMGSISTRIRSAPQPPPTRGRTRNPSKPSPPHIRHNRNRRAAGARNPLRVCFSLLRRFCTYPTAAVLFQTGILSFILPYPWDRPTLMPLPQELTDSHGEMAWCDRSR